MVKDGAFCHQSHIGQFRLNSSECQTNRASAVALQDELAQPTPHAYQDRIPLKTRTIESDDPGDVARWLGGGNNRRAVGTGPLVRRTGGAGIPEPRPSDITQVTEEIPLGGAGGVAGPIPSEVGLAVVAVFRRRGCLARKKAGALADILN